MHDSKQAIELPINRIIQGDCREILLTLPEKSVDLVFADPPYNLQLGGDLLRPNLSLVDKVDDEWDSFADFEVYDEFTTDWLNACKYVMKDTATIWVIGTYHNIHRIGKILQDLDFWILNEILWIKPNPMPNFRGVRFTNAHETLLWATKSRRKRSYSFNYGVMKSFNDDVQMRSDWEIPVCGGQERLKSNGTRLHSTQKPEELLERVILSSTNEGDIVLDPFFGTGTTGAAAKKLGRRWVGIERDPIYIQAATDRIERTVQLPPLIWIEKRRLRKIPFGSLVTSGMIEAGTLLYFDKSEDRISTVLKDGRVVYGDFVGSIHQAGARAAGLSACNGWDHWFLKDPETGLWVLVDTLRDTYRKKTEDVVPSCSESNVI